MHLIRLSSLIILLATNLHSVPLIQNDRDLNIPERRLCFNKKGSLIPSDPDERKEISEALYNLPNDLVGLLNEFVGKEHYQYQIQDIQLGSPSMDTLGTYIVRPVIAINRLRRYLLTPIQAAIGAKGVYSLIQGDLQSYWHSYLILHNTNLLRVGSHQTTNFLTGYLLTLSDNMVRNMYGHSEPIYFRNQEGMIQAYSTERQSIIDNRDHIQITPLFRDTGNEASSRFVTKDPESNTLQISYAQGDEIVLSKILLPAHEEVSGVTFSGDRTKIFIGTKSGTIFYFRQHKDSKDQPFTDTQNLYTRKKR